MLPGETAAQQMIAMPRSCSTMFAQMPCALPPAIKHKNRKAGATASRARLSIGLYLGQGQPSDGDFNLLSNVG